MNKTLLRCITQPLANVLGQKLSGAIYHDVMPADSILSNPNGTDIISHQLQLNFANKASVYISWADIKGWVQFSLSVSVNSFRSWEQFPANSANWLECAGKCFSSYQILGYLDEKIVSTNCDTGEELVEHYYHNPHMLLLHFEEHLVAVTNCYAEKNFVPQLSFGDDIWIMFDKGEIQMCTNRLGFELLEA